MSVFNLSQHRSYVLLIIYLTLNGNKTALYAKVLLKKRCSFLLLIFVTINVLFVIIIVYVYSASFVVDVVIMIVFYLYNVYDNTYYEPWCFKFTLNYHKN